MRQVLIRSFMSRMEKTSPSFFRRIENQVLYDIMAKACGIASKKIFLLPADQGLAAYAAFTKECMEKHLADPKRIYSEAYKTGKRITKITGLKTAAERKRLVFLLYRNIHITMSGELPGEIIVSACYFSRLYTPEQCAMMSNADAGIISGIMGEGKLIFTQRLSEGCSACKARFTQGGQNK